MTVSLSLVAIDSILYTKKYRIPIIIAVLLPALGLWYIRREWAAETDRCYNLDTLLAELDREIWV